MGRYSKISLTRFAAVCAIILVVGLFGETDVHASRKSTTDSVTPTSNHDTTTTPPPTTTPPQVDRPVAPPSLANEAKATFDKIKARFTAVTDYLGGVSLRTAKKRLINTNEPPLGSICAKTMPDGSVKQFAAIVHMVDPKAYDEDDDRPAGLVISAYGDKMKPDYFSKRNQSWQEAKAAFQIKNRAILAQRKKDYAEWTAWRDSQDYRKAQQMQIYADRIKKIDEQLRPDQAEVDEYIADEEDEAKDYYKIKENPDGSQDLLMRKNTFARRDLTDREHPGELVYHRRERNALDSSKTYESTYEVVAEDNGNVLVRKQKIDTEGKVVEEVLCW